jgi:hypothetical protein
MTSKHSESKSSKINVALYISIASLLISGLNFYYNNLRIKNKLQAKVNDYSIRINSVTKKIDTVLIRVVFINKGNRQCTVLQPWYELADSTENVDRTSILLSKTSFPNILLPGETRYIDFQIPLSNIISKLNNPDQNNNQFYCYCRIKLLAQDFNFMNHTAFSEFLIKIEYTKDEIIRLRDYKNKPISTFPTITLI